MIFSCQYSWTICNLSGFWSWVDFNVLATRSTMLIELNFSHILKFWCNWLPFCFWNICISPNFLVSNFWILDYEFLYFFISACSYFWIPGFLYVCIFEFLCVGITAFLYLDFCIFGLLNICASWNIIYVLFLAPSLSPVSLIAYLCLLSLNTDLLSFF